MMAKCTLFTFLSLPLSLTLSLSLSLPATVTHSKDTGRKVCSTISSVEIQNEVVETMEMEHTKKAYHEAEHL